MTEIGNHVSRVTFQHVCNCQLATKNINPFEADVLVLCGLFRFNLKFKQEWTKCACHNIYSTVNLHLEVLNELLLRQTSALKTIDTFKTIVHIRQTVSAVVLTELYKFSTAQYLRHSCRLPLISSPKMTLSGRCLMLVYTNQSSLARQIAQMQVLTVCFRCH